MKKKNPALVYSLIRGATAAAVAVLALASGAASADELPCEAPGRLVPISGKILTNALGPGDTLGVLAGKIDGMPSLKCGIHGKAFFNPDGSFGGFTHTLVCDDVVPAQYGGERIHTQAVSISRFSSVPDFRSCGIPGLEFGSFTEVSDPQSGRGIFSPTGGGRLYIDGTVNCAGAVDMKFTGKVCLVP
ncbi:hypothetical protein [Aromatoleum petrolei]|uniref:Secreted protein n=1 Tax=Aromatoleum petrolei TaxID=76116 RepID=A0ABX1MMX9_9RHOO|nr:hypothetical protein [Aromatoleum petrolei]NMF89133.1 hypothetical protein [Aromatoleum petrolei]QTQ36549.1 Uncharacterized protein ToN1_24100 [Aromatoleum petrolei]